MTRTRIALIARNKWWLKSKKKPKDEKQRLFDQLDDLWRRVVKLVYGKFDGDYYYCEMCGKACKSGKGVGRGLGINAHHIEGKATYNLRWCVPNGIPLDSGCHTMRKDSAHQDRSAFLKKMIDKRGQEWYDKLLKVKKENKKWTIMDMKKKKEELQNLIKKYQ